MYREPADRAGEPGRLPVDRQRLDPQRQRRAVHGQLVPVLGHAARDEVVAKSRGVREVEVRRRQCQLCGAVGGQAALDLEHRDPPPAGVAVRGACRARQLAVEDERHATRLRRAEPDHTIGSVAPR